MVYPRLTSDMPLAEKAHAFNINKNALESINLPIKTFLRQLGDTLGCGPVVTFTAGAFEEVAEKQLRENISESATTYHKASGHIIKDTVDASNDNKLKPLRNGLKESEARHDGIKYAKLLSILNFSSIDPGLTTNYQFSWYHILPTSSIEVKIDGNKKTFHSTFVGPADWATLTDPVDVAKYWNHPTAIKEAFNLSEPTIKDKHSEAEINISRAQHRLENIVFTAGAEKIKKAIFEHICPSYIDDPATALLKIKQVVPDSVDPSKTMTLDVQTYHDKTLRLMEQLGVKSEFKIDVVQHFFQNLTQKLKDQVKIDGYTGDMKIGSRKPQDQFRDLKDLYTRAIKAEYQISREQKNIREIMNSHSTFLTSPVNVNVSTAEKAIKTYKEGTKLDCWGCGGNHSWYSAREKKIVCPNRDDPKCIAQADKKIKEFKQKKRDKQENRKKKKKIDAILSEVLKDVGSDDEEAIKEKLRNTLLSTEVPGSPTKKARTAASGSNLILLYHVLSSAIDSKPILDIPVFKCLPHFTFHIGKPDSSFHPQLQPAYDTCASLNCGYLPYHTAIAKNYPELVKEIVWSGDKYSPILLQGAVKDENQQAENTTALTAVIEYYTPYITVDGGHTTLKVAIGNDVSANLILGMATIKAARLTLDVSDDVITSAVLVNFAPSSVVFKSTSRGLPNLLPKDNDNENMNLHIKQVKEIACMIELGSKKHEDKAKLALQVNMSNTKHSDTKAEIQVEAKKDIKSILKSPELKNVHFEFLDEEITSSYFY